MIRCLIVLLLGGLLVDCSESTKEETVSSEKEIISPVELPTETVDLAALYYDTKTSTWTLDGRRFTGYAVSYYQDSTLKQKFGLLDGKKQNEAKDWFPDGSLHFSSNYHQGKLHGEKKAWTSDTTHILISHLNYYLGKVHGEQKKWYPTGEIFKILHLNMGKEEGIQQAFRKNGALFANYEAREGRIFGLKKAALCYGLEEETVQYEGIKK